MVTIPNKDQRHQTVVTRERKREIKKGKEREREGEGEREKEREMEREREFLFVNEPSLPFTLLTRTWPFDIVQTKSNLILVFHIQSTVC